MARAKRLRSKTRGVASAKAACKVQLKTCMRSPASGALKTGLKSCMTEFNSCRGVGKGKKRTAKKAKKAKKARKAKR